MYTHVVDNTLQWSPNLELEYSDEVIGGSLQDIAAVERDKVRVSQRYRGGRRGSICG